MIATLLLACGTDGAGQLPPPVFEEVVFPTTPSTSVTEEIPVEASPVDVLLAVDPALMDEVTADLPALVDFLLVDEVDARLGLVSTALGDPATAGELLPLGPDGWWEVDGAPPSLDVPIPDEPPLGGLGATFLALRTARPSAGIRVLVVQEVDDETPASIVTEPEFVDWFADLGDAELSAVAPVPSTRLDDAVAQLGGQRFELGTDLGVALEAVGTSLPGLSRTFAIAGRPDPETLVVQVRDAGGAIVTFVSGEHWVFDEAAHTITFVEFVPGPGSTVLVTYDALR